MSTLFFNSCYDSLVYLLAWGDYKCTIIPSKETEVCSPPLFIHPFKYCASCFSFYLFILGLFHHETVFCPAGKGKRLSASLHPPCSRASCVNHIFSLSTFLSPQVNPEKQSIFQNAEWLVKRDQMLFYCMDDFWKFQISLFCANFLKSFTLYWTDPQKTSGVYRSEAPLTCSSTDRGDWLQEVAFLYLLQLQVCSI